MGLRSPDARKERSEVVGLGERKWELMGGNSDQRGPFYLRLSTRKQRPPR